MFSSYLNYQTGSFQNLVVFVGQFDLFEELPCVTNLLYFWAFSILFETDKINSKQQLINVLI